MNPITSLKLLGDTRYIIYINNIICVWVYKKVYTRISYNVEDVIHINVVAEIRKEIKSNIGKDF